MDLYKHISLKLLFLVVITQVSAQTTPVDSSQKTIYTGVYNQVKSQFPFPLLGFVNHANGNQSNAHVGFTNLTADTFSGVQVGLVNKVGASIGGVQCGLVNLVTAQATGVQVGMINAVQQGLKGVQIGFVSTLQDTLNGVQVGYINTVNSKVDGAQVGFLNVSTQDVKGAQIGYINVTAKTIKGIQVGFINVADSFSSGIPVGFLSFVKHGGYYALELSSNETYRYNITGKVGVKSLYTLIQLSYNPEFKNQFGSGLGLGSIIPITRYINFNPELMNTRVITKRNINFTQLNPALQFGSTKWAFNIGPTITWTNIERNSNNAEVILLPTYKPSQSFYYEKLDAKNALHIGAKAGLVFNF